MSAVHLICWVALTFPLVTTSTELSCTPTDAWITVQSLDNLAGKDPASMEVSYTIGMTSSSGTSDTVSSSKTNEGGVTAEISIGIKEIFGAKLGGEFKHSSTTGHDWQTTSSSEFQKSRTTTTTKTVGAGRKTVMQQVVGTCGDYQVYTDNVKLVDEGEGLVTTTEGPPPRGTNLPCHTGAECESKNCHMPNGIVGVCI